MFTTRFQTATRLSIATLALAGLALGVASAPSVDAAGIRNCVDISPAQSGRVSCYEDVWAGGTQVRMTFANQRFGGATPKDLDPFYVLAPQTDTPQGAPPNTFPHDHVVRDVPAQNHGDYSTKLQGFFVLCSGQGITSGSCQPSWTHVGGPDPLPLATTADGHALTSAGAIEAAADSGSVALINLGPGADHPRHGQRPLTSRQTPDTRNRTPRRKDLRRMEPTCTTAVPRPRSASIDFDAQDRARRGRPLPAHVRQLDPGRLPAGPGPDRSELHHRRHRRRHPGAPRRPASTSSTASPPSAPRSRSTRSSSARTRASRSASSALDCSKARSS